MGIKELIGMESERKVRYAIVGLGDIAQEDMMPGVDHTGNSEITALITSDPVKANELAKKYGVQSAFSYEAVPPSPRNRELSMQSILQHQTGATRSLSFPR